MHPTTERQLDSVLAWHFVADTLRDGRPVPADGEVLRHEGPMVLCESGLHASVRSIDALTYAPGNTVCRVRMAGDIQHQSDKMISRERTIVWRIDATDVLRAFGRQCALDVAHLWTMPHVVRRYLETGDEALRAAARDAAWAAARAAARAAAWDARDARDARAAAWAAAWAAWAAARDARAAAWAARDAAWAARDARDAAWAARDARDARDAARDAQNARLEAAIYAAAGRTPEDNR